MDCIESGSQEEAEEESCGADAVGTEIGIGDLACLEADLGVELVLQGVESLGTVEVPHVDEDEGVVIGVPSVEVTGRWASQNLAWQTEQPVLLFLQCHLHPSVSDEHWHYPLLADSDLAFRLAVHDLDDMAEGAAPYLHAALVMNAVVVLVSEVVANPWVAHSRL